MGDEPATDTEENIFTLVERGAAEQVAERVRRDPALVQARRDDGATPLHVAAAGGHKEVVSALLAHGAEVNARDHRGWTPLHALIEMSARIDVADLLLAHGADIDARDNLGHSPVSLAARFIHGPGSGGWTAPVATLLADAPALVNACDAGGYTPLHLAAWNGKRDTTALLLDAGADIDARNGRGETPLALAAPYENEDGMSEIIDLLLDRGATADIFTAARLGLVEGVTARLREDPDRVHAHNRYGRTPMQCAVEKALWIPLGTRWGRHWDVANLLAAHGAPIETNIWTACALGQHEQVASLLRADPRLANASGRSALTPLHWAAYHGHAAVVDLLLAHGAEVRAADPYLGKTPSQWAHDAGHGAIVERLRRP